MTSKPIGQMTRNPLAVLSTNHTPTATPLLFLLGKESMLQKDSIFHISREENILLDVCKLISNPQDSALHLFTRQFIVIMQVRFAVNVTINLSKLMKSLLLSDMPLHSYLHV